MKPDIISKLRDELREPIHSERQVVYILAELRKLMELEAIERNERGAPPDNSHFALKFYCDWAVHVRLDQAGAKRIVQRFNQFQGLNEKLAAPGGEVVTVDPNFLQELDENLQLANFRRQLGTYLTSHDLDGGLASDEGRWVEFLAYYSHVIEDAPLISEAKGLEWVDSVSVRVLDERPAGAADHTLAITWTWTSKKDGTRKNKVRLF